MTPSAAMALMVKEALRTREFPGIEFRDTVVGRQAYLSGTRLKVWQIVSFCRAVNGDVEETASLLSITTAEVSRSLAYAEAYPDEINSAIEDNHPTLERLRELIPNLEVVMVSELRAPAP